MDGISKVWPKWQAVEVLGEGGFGKVYKAKRDSFGESMYSAIKVVRIPNNKTEVDEMTTSGLSYNHIRDYYFKSVAGLVDEIKMMDKLKSAGHIVGIEDFEVVENENTIGWTIYIRMELLTNLSNHLKTTSNLVEEVKKMAIHILNALEHCHELNIIHRDIKPANIFISKFGEYKLGDFGVSREVEKTNATLSQKGTKSYMAPEMVRMEKYDKTVDLYALGLTMYELLNHNRMPFLPPFPEPFFPTDREEAMIKRLTGLPFPKLEGIGELNDIILKACHSNPKMRYQTATEMKKALMDLEISSTSIETLEDEEDLIEEGLNFNFDDEKTIIGDETTIGMFGGNSPFFNKKEQIEEKKIESNLGPVAEGQTINPQLIVNRIILEFKRKEFIDLSTDMLAMGRIQEKAKEVSQQLLNNDSVRVSIPYIASNANGALHIDLTLNRQSFYENKSHKVEEHQKDKNTKETFLFDDHLELEDLQRKCPYCGKTSYLQFSHGYYCPSCDKIHTTTNDATTKKLSDLSYKFLHSSSDANKRYEYSREMYELDQNNAQTIISYGQSIGNLGNEAKQRELYLRAHQIDPRDAGIYNNLAVSYIKLGDFNKAYQYSLKGLNQKPYDSSSWTLSGTAWANHSIALEKTGRSKEAFNALLRAYRNGYANCDLLCQNWNVGKAYCTRVVKDVFNRYNFKLKIDTYTKNLNKATNKFGVHKNETFLLNIEGSYGLFGDNSTAGIALTDMSLRFISKTKYYLHYYMFANTVFTINGKKINIKVNNTDYPVNIGSDAINVCALLSELQTELLKQ